MQNLEMKQLYLVATILLSLILGASTFSYKNAKNWGKEFPKCNGRNQSPVILKEPLERNWPVIKQNMRFTDFEKLPTKMTITNTGHTVEIKANWSGEPPKVTGPPLNGTYVFEKITFHWSEKENEKGAEHMWYNPVLQMPKWYDMEMHMFFYRTDFKSFKKAESEEDGLAVISVMLTSETYGQKPLLKELQRRLCKVQSINSTTVIPPFKLAHFIDNPVTFFVFYEGSLDYPPCSESVNWFIYEANVPISKSLLNAFRKIKLAEGDVSNVRPPQALNNRPVKMASVDYRDLP